MKIGIKTSKRGRRAYKYEVRDGENKILATGLTKKEIAKRLDVSYRQVEYQTSLALEHRKSVGGKYYLYKVE